MKEKEEFGQKPKVNIIELGNMRIVSETDSLEKVAKLFSKMVRKNFKLINPKDEIPPTMFG